MKMWKITRTCLFPIRNWIFCFFHLSNFSSRSGVNTYPWFRIVSINHSEDCMEYCLTIKFCIKISSTMKWRRIWRCNVKFIPRILFASDTFRRYSLVMLSPSRKQNQRVVLILYKSLPLRWRKKQKYILSNQKWSKIEVLSFFLERTVYYILVCI